jgi:PhzF family phenazine biosynthesis protein
MGQSIFQVDAFTKKIFTGNPAAVCILDRLQEDSWMQKLAQEMNLSETAFLYPQDDGYSLRWFTPTTEVPLCGHATLASAHVLWSENYLAKDKTARFHTQSGLLVAKKQEDWIELDFPVVVSEKIETPPELSQALGVPIKLVLQNSFGYFLVEVESEGLIREMQPDFSLLKKLPGGKAIVTSLTHQGSQYDFVSRFFAPGLGIDEDPVTGSAHCCLASFWRDRLEKNEFLAYQSSNRGGEVKVLYDGGDRVILGGQAVTVFKAELNCPAE